MLCQPLFAYLLLPLRASAIERMPPCLPERLWQVSPPHLQAIQEVCWLALLRWSFTGAIITFRRDVKRPKHIEACLGPGASQLLLATA